LLIDTDSQGHATLVTTGRNDYGADDSLYAVLSADRANAAQTLANCVVPSTWDEYLHVLPASPMLEGAERELMRVSGAPYRLADPLSRIAGHYAAVIIDTHPSFSLLTEMGLIAATDAIVPVEPRYLETVGLMNVISKINDIREGWRHPGDEDGHPNPRPQSSAGRTQSTRCSRQTVDRCDSCQRGGVLCAPQSPERVQL
jgi:cellulose biosynthesis protein BcsQ